ncbi:DUF397 domain-containing protein [Streptomyces sp. NPDC021020]|uniref:DUF397 domain-containing protein n=1 Tax=Streptomyces sp. NPDC021020 TaxID=3365109 RepID=UPI00379C1014
MMLHDLPEGSWYKSSYSSDTGGNCIETQPAPQGLVAVRDSKTPALGAHAFAATEWQHFVNAVRNGEFDL